MERLTSNKNVSEMGIYELAHNSCYTKDGKARYRDYDTDMDARELTRKLLIDHAGGDDAFDSDEDFDEWMVDYLQYGMDSIEGLIALFYRNLWAMADLRERLKYYEDLEEQGKFLIFPCGVGDTVYRINKGAEQPIIPLQVMNFKIFNNDLVQSFKMKCVDEWDGAYTYGKTDIGRDVFITKEQAEAALHGDQQ